MHKTILMLLLAAVSNNAIAEWVKVAENEKLSMYRDSPPNQKKGNFIETLWLLDYKTTQSSEGQSFLSIRIQNEINCKKDQIRNIESSVFYGRMGAGEKVSHSTKLQEWTKSTPDSISETMIKVACDKTNIGSDLSKNWVLFDGDPEITGYIDPSTIRRKGNKVKVWHLYDFKESQIDIKGNSYLSVQVQDEFDCIEDQSRILYLSHHSQHMGRGSIVYSDNIPDNEWRPIPPNTKIESIKKIACRKK